MNKEEILNNYGEVIYEDDGSIGLWCEDSYTWIFLIYKSIDSLYDSLHNEVYDTVNDIENE